MAKVEVYTTQVCPHCVRAKSLLDRKGVSYETIDVSTDDELRMAMMERAGGRRTVPQIFINDQHIGGADDLYALDKKGGLDPLLAS
jgi:glutaredoxin 3